MVLSLYGRRLRCKVCNKLVPHKSKYPQYCSDKCKEIWKRRVQYMEGDTP